MKRTLRLLLLLLMTTTVFAQSGVRPKPPSRPETLTIPAGTQARVELQTPIYSKLNEVGDEVSGTLESSISVNGYLALRKGTEIKGRITQITAAKRPQRQASMTIVFDTITIPEGEKEVEVVIKAIDDYANEEKLKPKDEGKVEGGRSGGRTVDNVIKGGKIGTIVGLPIIILAGTPGVAAPLGGVAAGVILTKGDEIRLSPGTVFRIEFSKPFTIGNDPTEDLPERPAKRNLGLKGN
jgi:hypothetical protein